MSRTQTIFIAVIIIIVAVFLLVFLGILPGLKSLRPAAVSLEVWGFDDDERIWRDTIKQFKEAYPHISVTYRRIDESAYENTLVNRLAEGTGPDVFMLRNSWLFAHRDKIFPLPQSAFQFTPRDFAALFVDAPSQELTDEDGNILGIPLSMDSLALFYDRDVFNAAGIPEAPKTWDDVIGASRALTKLDERGNIVRSGMALGASRNVEHAFEIVNALALQNGNTFFDIRGGTLDIGTPTADAFDFYTSFADRTKQNFSWTAALPFSIDSLAEGKTAMAFAFLEDINRVLAKNPHLSLGIAPFPQLKDAQKQATFARYPFFTVSKLSKNRGNAWQFVLFAAGKEQAKMLLEKTGRAPARRDLITTRPAKTELEVFHRQSLIARSWSIPDESAVRRLFESTIDDIVSKKTTTKNAVDTLRDRLKLLLP